jgi:hypothetical protein
MLFGVTFKHFGAHKTKFGFAGPTLHAIFFIMTLTQVEALGTLCAAVEQLLIEFTHCTFYFTAVILNDCFFPQIRRAGVPAFGACFKVLVRMDLRDDSKATPTEEALAARTMHFITSLRLLDWVLAFGTALSAFVHIN